VRNIEQGKEMERKMKKIEKITAEMLGH